MKEVDVQVSRGFAKVPTEKARASPVHLANLSVKVRPIRSKWLPSVLKTKVA